MYTPRKPTDLWQTSANHSLAHSLQGLSTPQALAPRLLLSTVLYRRRPEIINLTIAAGGVLSPLIKSARTLPSQVRPLSECDYVSKHRSPKVLWTPRTSLWYGPCTVCMGLSVRRSVWPIQPYKARQTFHPQLSDHLHLKMFAAISVLWCGFYFKRMPLCKNTAEEWFCKLSHFGLDTLKSMSTVCYCTRLPWSDVCYSISFNEYSLSPLAWRHFYF